MQFSAWQHAHPVSREVVLWPGITNNEQFARQIQDRFLKDVIAFGESPLAKASGFDGPGRILNYPGYPSLPYSFPNIDNKLGSVEMDPDFVVDLQETFLILFSDYPKHVCARPMTLRRQAMSGLPSFTRDLKVRVKELNNIFTHLDAFGKGIVDRDFAGLRDQFGLTPLATCGSRTQTDAVLFENGRWVPKQREAIVSWDPTTNKQERVVINKSLRQYGLDCDLVAMRHRTIYAIPSLMNIPLEPVGNAFFDCFVEKYEFTFHQGDIYEFIKRSDVRDRLRGRRLLSFDFKEFDHSVPDQALWLFCTLMRKVGVPEWLVNLAYDCTHLPCVMNGTTIDGSDAPPHVFGDLQAWWRAGRMIHFGLPSGWIFTALFPKWFVTTLIYHVLWKHCKVIPHDRSEYIKMLQWDSSSPVVDMCGGDDNCLALMERAYAAVYDKFCQGISLAVPTMKVSWDDRPQFLSHIFVKDQNGALIAYPDIIRGFTNSFCPAESAFHTIYRAQKSSYNTEHLFRYYGITGTADPEMLKGGTRVPAFGWFQKDALYTQRSPGWAALRDLMYDFLKKCNPHVVQNLHQIADVESTLLARLQVDPRNMADIDILISPEKIFYRHTEEEISDSVYKLSFASFGEEYLQKIKPYYLR